MTVSIFFYYAADLISSHLIWFSHLILLLSSSHFTSCHLMCVCMFISFCFTVYQISFHFNSSLFISFLSYGKLQHTNPIFWVHFLSWPHQTHCKSNGLSLCLMPKPVQFHCKSQCFEPISHAQIGWTCWFERVGQGVGFIIELGDAFNIFYLGRRADLEQTLATCKRRCCESPPQLFGPPAAPARPRPTANGPSGQCLNEQTPQTYGKHDLRLT